MNYGTWMGHNLHPTYSAGTNSPDIVSNVHKMKAETIYAKQIVPQLHILRAFQKGIANSRYT